MRRLLLPLLVLALAAMPARAFDLFNLKNSLIEFALEQISTEDFAITAEGVESPGDGVTELVGVEISDREGVWFTAERMGLQWNARRILSAELEINRLGAEGVRILRAPVGEVEVKEDAEIAEDDGEPFDWPRSPIATRIEEMRLDRVFVAEGVIAEQSLAFDAVGSARDEGDIQAVDLTVTRTDAVSGRIAVDYERDFAAGTLRANLDAEEAAGGLVVALAGFPNDSASRVRLRADGPLTDWGMEVQAETERVFEAGGKATVDLEGPLAVLARFRVVPGPAIDPALAAVLGAEARLDFDVQENQQGVVAIREGAIRSPALTLDATGAYDKATGRADLDVVLDGRSELAGLAEGVEFAGFGFEGTVRGTPQDLAAEGRLRLDALATEPADVGAARLAAVVRIEGERIGVSLDGTAERLRLDRIGPDLLGTAELAARGAYEGERVTLEAFSLDAVPLDATASGAVDLAAETAALDYALAAPDLAPLARAYEVAAEGRAEIEGRVEGPFAAIRATGTAALRNLVFEGEPYGAVELSHDVTAGETVEGGLVLAASGSPVGPVDADLDFALRGERLDLSRLEAKALGAEIAGQAVYRLDSGLAEGRLDLDAPDLAPLSDLLGGPVSGRVAGTVTLTPEGGRQSATLDLEADRLAALEATLAEARIEARVTDALGAPGVTAEIAASGARGFGAEAERLTLSAEARDATTLAALTADLAAEGLGYAGARIARLEADIAAENALTDAPAATLTARATSLAAPDGAATAGGLDLTAEIASAEGATDGRATARLSDIRAGEARIPRLDAEATGRGLLGDAPALEAALSAPTVEAGAARLASVRLDATVTDALAAPKIDARLRTGEALAGPAELSGIEATLRGALSALVATLSAEGEAEGAPVSLSARAEIDAEAPAPRIRVTELDALYKGERAALAAPMTVTAGESVTLEGIDLALPGGGLRGEAALHPAGLSADLALELADLAIAERLADAPIGAGALDARLAYDSRPGRANASLDLAATGLRFTGAVADVGALDLSATGRWDGRQGDLGARLDGPFREPLRLEAALPLRARGGPLPEIPGDGALSGRVVWSGDIGELWVLVPAPGHVLDGALDIDLGIAGTLAAPRIDGRLALSDGHYENLDLGTILTDIALDSRLAGDGGIALDLSASDAAGGRVEASAEVNAEAVEAQVTARRAVLIRRDDATAAISLDIAAAGPLAGPDISGTVTVDRAEIRLVNATPPSVVTLGDVRIKGAPEPEEAPPAGGAIDLDVRVRADRDVFVRGRGLDSEWRIGLDVGGTAAAPVVTGSVDRVRGQLSLVGTRFDLKTGRVRFLGGREIDPRLEVDLEAEENDVTGGIRVRGTASAPEIGFYSRQGLPEDEVLPRLLFGKPSQSLTASQAIRLASGIATLTDGSGGVVDDIRGAVGLDELAIDPTEESAEVTIGKNLGDSVFVGAKQSVDGKESKVVVEVEVFDNIVIDSEVDQEGDAGLGIQWKKDF